MGKNHGCNYSITSVSCSVQFAADWICTFYICVCLEHFITRNA